MNPKLEEIRKILHFDWDPIGVSDDPDSAGEYDSYATHVFSLLNRQPDQNSIVDYLDMVEVEYMGFAGPCGRSEKCGTENNEESLLVPTGLIALSNNFASVVASVAKQSRASLGRSGLPRRLRLLAMTGFGDCV